MLKIVNVFRHKKYIYDSITNKLYSSNIHHRCYQIVQDLKTEYGSDYATKPFLEVVYPISANEMIKHVMSNMKTLVLQITRRCNLDCKYCVYSGHFDYMSQHDNIDMSKETICKSIDLFKRYCNDVDNVSVDFYGGEALTRFDLIKFAVFYVSQSLINKKLHFKISTNGTTISDSVLAWIKDNPQCKYCDYIKWFISG